jgi:hypothetical protein
MQDEETQLKALAKEGLAQIATWLEAGAPHVNTPSGKLVGFNMANVDVITPCGTMCCIAGALSHFNPAAENAWNLTYDGNHGSALFMPPDYRIDPSYNDPTRAARVIRHFIETETVDWSV